MKENKKINSLIEKAMIFNSMKEEFMKLNFESNNYWDTCVDTGCDCVCDVSDCASSDNINVSYD